MVKERHRRSRRRPRSKHSDCEQDRVAHVVVLHDGAPVGLHYQTFTARALSPSRTWGNIIRSFHAAVSKESRFSPADGLVAQTVVNLAIWTARLRRLSTIMKVRIHRISKRPPACSMAQSRSGYNLSPGLCPRLFFRFRTLMLRRRGTDGQSRRIRATHGGVFVRGRKFERQVVIVGHFCCLFYTWCRDWTVPRVCFRQARPFIVSARSGSPCTLVSFR